MSFVQAIGTVSKPVAAYRIRTASLKCGGSSVLPEDGNGGYSIQSSFLELPAPRYHGTDRCWSKNLQNLRNSGPTDAAMKPSTNL